MTLKSHLWTATLCLATVSGVAQQSAARPAVLPAAAEEQESAQPKKPGTEGIRVHGHWLIDLKDKDGKVLEHRDFQNSLQLDGGDLLAKVLSGQAVIPSLQIQAGTQGSLPFYTISRTDLANKGVSGCSASSPGPYCVGGLTSTYHQYTHPAGCTTIDCYVPSNITLNGSFTAVAAITVNSVYTAAIQCSNATTGTALLTLSPASCGAYQLDVGIGTSNVSFTGTAITPISVATGEMLAITVILTFS